MLIMACLHKGASIIVLQQTTVNKICDRVNSMAKGTLITLPLSQWRTALMKPIQKLNLQGFVVLHRVISSDAVNALRVIARKSKLPWDNEDPSSPGMLRVYADMPREPAMTLSTTLQPYFRTFFPAMDPSMVCWQYLKARDKAPEQPIHRNFAQRSQNPMDATMTPGSLLLATQDDTLIYGFGWNHLFAFESRRVAIQLQKGDIIFFRGDFIHSRAGSDGNTLCVHAFMGAVRYPQLRPLYVPLYDCFPRDEHSFRCYVWGCSFEATSQRGLTRHVREVHNFFVNARALRHVQDEEDAETNAEVQQDLAPAMTLSIFVGGVHTRPDLIEDDDTTFLGDLMPGDVNSDNEGTGLEVFLAAHVGFDAEIENVFAHVGVANTPDWDMM